MEADLYLADSATVGADGKVSALGIGWTTNSSPLTQFALVAFLRIPRKYLGKRLEVAFHLHRVRGGAPVKNGRGEPIRAEGWLQVDSLIDVNGLAFETPVAVTIPQGLVLSKGVYEWRMDVNSAECARRRFAILGERATASPEE